MSIRGTNRFHSMPVSVESTGGIPGAPGRRYDSTLEQEETFTEQFHKIAQKIDDFLGETSQPIKPYLPGLARLLIVATFIEDALRLFTQWESQKRFLLSMRHVPGAVSSVFLAVNIVLMLSGSFSIVFKRKLRFGFGALLCVIFSQAIIYGLITNFPFLFRNISVIGSLVMALSDDFVRNRRFLPDLPMIDDKDKSKYLQLAGRVLLVFLFVAFCLLRKWTFWNVVFNLVCLVGCTLVTIGYKARLSASILSILLSGMNLLTNQYWLYGLGHPTYDYLRYEFFQTLCIVGGLILIVSGGAGKISIDEKKKIY